MNILTFRGVRQSVRRLQALVTAEDASTSKGDSVSEPLLQLFKAGFSCDVTTPSLDRPKAASIKRQLKTKAWVFNIHV